MSRYYRTNVPKMNTSINQVNVAAEGSRGLSPSQHISQSQVGPDQNTSQISSKFSNNYYTPSKRIISTPQIPPHHDYNISSSTVIPHHLGSNQGRAMIQQSIQRSMRGRANRNGVVRSKSPINMITSVPNARESSSPGDQFAPALTRDNLYPVNLGYGGQQPQPPIIFNHVTISPRKEKDENFRSEEKTSEIWGKFMTLSNERLKSDCRGIIEEMSYSTVDKGHALLGAYNILNRPENREVVEYEGQELTMVRDRIKDAHKRHRLELADIIDEMKTLIGPASRSSCNDLDIIANNLRYVENNDDPQIIKNEMIDLSLISNPSLTRLSPDRRTEVLGRNPTNYMSRSRYKKGETSNKIRNRGRSNMKQNAYSRNKTPVKDKKRINLTQQPSTPPSKLFINS